MDHETTLSKAKDIADDVLAPAAHKHDKEGRFSTQAVAALSQAGCAGPVIALGRATNSCTAGDVRPNGIGVAEKSGGQNPNE